MPWVDAIAGLVQAWYLGNEAGGAIADVIYGTVNPGGRLPLTLPIREEDIPAHLNDKSEHGKIQYVSKGSHFGRVNVVSVAIGKTSSLVISTTKRGMSSPCSLSGKMAYLL